MKLLTKEPKEITLAYLEVIVMPSGEVLNKGKSLGWMDKLQPYLFMKETK